MPACQKELIGDLAAWRAHIVEKIQKRNEAAAAAAVAAADFAGLPAVALPAAACASIQPAESRHRRRCSRSCRRPPAPVAPRHRILDILSCGLSWPLESIELFAVGPPMKIKRRGALNGSHAARFRRIQTHPQNHTMRSL